MRYREVLSQAYTLTVRNPLLWLFGLVMLGGFNLSLINFVSIFPTEHWKEWPLKINFLFGTPFLGWGLTVFSVIFIFITLNIVKTVFVTTIHGLIHEKHLPQDFESCLLCSKRNQILPYTDWLPRVIKASLITICITVGVTFLSNQFIKLGNYDGNTAILVNFIFIALVTVVMGIWNAFTSYFIILFDLNFAKASSAAIALMSSKFIIITEFVVILSVIHTASVFVMNCLINIWNIQGLLFYVFEAIVVFWFAVNNTFFNIAFLIFFDKLVKMIPKEQPAVRLLHENRLN